MGYQEQRITSNVLCTSYQQADVILADYRRRMEKLGTAFECECSEIEKTILSDRQFDQVLRNAFEMALEEVKERTPGRERYVCLKGMVMHRKLFLKLIYTSEDEQDIKNPHYQAIDEVLLKKGGYAKLENGDDINTIMIAVPME